MAVGETLAMWGVIVCYVLLLTVLVATFPKQFADWTNPFGEGWFKIWNENAGLRMAIEFVGALTLMFGVAGLWWDYQAKQEEREDRADQRLARMWAQGMDNRPGNIRRIPALEFLNKEGHPLAGISIPKAYLVEIDLTRANLRGANLRHATLRDANLKEANLWNANLEGANLSNATLEGANLWNANLEGANLWNANLEGAILLDANLESATLLNANLESATLLNANLEGANLGGANLGGATLLNANLRGANLGGANLRGANLRRTNLGGANLQGTKNLTQSQLDQTCGDKKTKLHEGLAIKPCEEEKE